jgi:hypothetical protein
MGYTLAGTTTRGPDVEEAVAELLIEATVEIDGSRATRAQLAALIGELDTSLTIARGTIVRANRILHGLEAPSDGALRIVERANIVA